jgi:hypothetical protein
MRAHGSTNSSVLPYPIRGGLVLRTQRIVGYGSRECPREEKDWTRPASASRSARDSCSGSAANGSFPHTMQQPARGPLSERNSRRRVLPERPFDTLSRYQPPRLKNCTARSCFCAAARVFSEVAAASGLGVLLAAIKAIAPRFEFSDHLAAVSFPNKMLSVQTRCIANCASLLGRPLEASNGLSRPVMA